MAYAGSPSVPRLRRVLRSPAFWLPLALLAAAGLLVALLGPIAWWATPAKHLQGKDKADARNATRQVLLAAVGGLVLATGAGFTARTYFLTRRGQLTDRYTKAITQLASDKLTERLGGIYALEHLMTESEREHPTVVEVLAAFVRDQTIGLKRTAPTPDVDGVVYDPPDGYDWPSPTTDVQAALTVLGRRPHRQETRPIDLTGAGLYYADLRGARLVKANLYQARLVDAALTHAYLQDATLIRATLTGANLVYARLHGADLHEAVIDQALLLEVDLRHANLSSASVKGARMRRAFLTAANLTDADLTGADLTAAELWNVDLSGANLTDAVLADADLAGAHLADADLSGADLSGANLSGANLKAALGLTSTQLAHCRTDKRTVLPKDLS
ncbi:pentapeptide repeat-containing protein [Couchioplanes caeruleus]|nr:pentapeptide repeat-containing protein [Couchioplanes caeruleus]